MDCKRKVTDVFCKQQVIIQLSGTSATISSLKAEVTKAKDKMNEDRKMFEKRLLTLTVL